MHADVWGLSFPLLCEFFYGDEERRHSVPFNVFCREFTAGNVEYPISSIVPLSQTKSWVLKELLDLCGWMIVLVDIQELIL